MSLTQTIEQFIGPISTLFDQTAGQFADEDSEQLANHVTPT